MNLRNISLLREKAYIDGQWVDAQDGATFNVYNPGNGSTVAAVARLGADEASMAVEAAARAFHEWSARTARERAAPLKAWAQLIVENADDLATILTFEQGKPLSDARNEVLFAASFVEWFAEQAKRTYGEVIPASSRTVTYTTVREPIGVAAGITPWNLPCAMVTRKAAPALAAGCTMVLKPAEDTPLSALALAELAGKAGIPAGVLNVITTDRAGSAQIGEILTTHPLVGKLSFTGSTGVGKRLTAACASSMKRVSMELGGNSPFIVCSDADVDIAVSAAMFAKFRNAGQTCIAPNRFFVHRAIEEAFIERLLISIRELRQGEGTLPGVNLGPLINENALRKAESHVADALKKGARLVTGGDRLDRAGHFYRPTVLTGVTPDMHMFQDETFGPVVGISVFDDEAQVIRIANDTRLGLASYVFSRDASRIHRITRALQAGIVGVNTGAIATEVAPFGGFKESGIGLEGASQGIDEFMETKFICQAFPH